MNFLLLTIDTLRADRLGRGLTPHLDRLVRGGVTFGQAISGGTWTQAAFPPLLTSSPAAFYGGCLGRLAAARPSPIATFSQAGYQTAGFVSNPLVGPRYGYERGFDHFQELVPADREPWLRFRYGGQWLLRQPITHWLRPMPPARVTVPAGELHQAAINWLTGVNGPFLAWLHYMDVHWPYHREETLTRPGQLAHIWRDLAHFHAVCWQGASLSRADQAHFARLYDTALAYLDDQIGQLLAALAASGRDKETVIVVIADHGEEFMEHGRWGHWENNLFDEIIRIPFILFMPHSLEKQFPARPERVEQLVSSLDLMPTLLELADCPVPAGVEGHSLLPLLRNDPAGYPRQQAISEMWRDHWHRIAVRTATWKLIWDSRQPHQPALYHLSHDPAEQADVSQHHPDIVAALGLAVDQHRQRTEQTRPENSPTPEPQADEALLNRLRGLGYLE